MLAFRRIMLASGMQISAERPAGWGEHLEAGFGSVEVLFAASVLAIAIMGSTIVFGQATKGTAQAVSTDMIRDVSDSVNIDAAAIAAFDPTNRARLASLAQQTTTVTVGHATATLKLSGFNSNAVNIDASTPDGSQATIVAPLPLPKPTP
jgi:hypothetical protein